MLRALGGRSPIPQTAVLEQEAEIDRRGGRERQDQPAEQAAAAAPGAHRDAASRGARWRRPVRRVAAPRDDGRACGAVRRPRAAGAPARVAACEDEHLIEVGVPHLPVVATAVDGIADARPRGPHRRDHRQQLPARAVIAAHVHERAQREAGIVVRSDLAYTIGLL